MEIDSTKVTKYMDQGYPTYNTLLYDYMRLMSRIGKLVMHNFRERNEVAHLLAREVADETNNNKPIYLAVPPPLIITRMLTDKDDAIFVKHVVDDVCRMLAKIGNCNALWGVFCVIVWKHFSMF